MALQEVSTWLQGRSVRRSTNGLVMLLRLHITYGETKYNSASDRILAHRKSCHFFNRCEICKGFAMAYNHCYISYFRPASPNNARIIAAYIPLKSGALTYDATFTSYCPFGFRWIVI